MNDISYSAPRAASKTVLVVIPEQAVRELVSANLRFAGVYPVGADSAQSGQSLMAEVMPDAVVVDLDAPGVIGTSLARRERGGAAGRRVPTLMLAKDPAESCGSQGAACGGDECVAKPFSPGDLVTRLLRMMGAVTRKPSSAVLVAGPLELDSTEHTVRVNGPGGPRHVSLPGVEFRLLQQLMSLPDRVHTREQLLGKLWRHNTGLDPRTVDQNIKRLRTNLAAVDAGHLVETVRGVGYRLSTDVRCS